uniref:C2H2-type domain-containing protein n=1 Tax=Xiphophorus couchianus TaxID=32473 RepID=A0A3B5LLH7_9TELE
MFGGPESSTRLSRVQLPDLTIFALVVKEEVPEMSSSSLDQQNLTCSQVKKEEEEQWISHSEKNEVDEKPQLAEVHHIKSEDSRQTETPTSSSAEQMKTESNGEISGGTEPNREPNPNPNLLTNIEERHSASSETEVSDEKEEKNLSGSGSENEDNDESEDDNISGSGSENEDSDESEDDNISGSGSENEDSDESEDDNISDSGSENEDWREPRTRQSGVNSKVGREKSSSCSVEKNHSRGKQNSDAQMGRKSFSCDDCGKIFQKLTALKSHMKIHRSKKLVVCKECGKSFRSQFQLKNHLTLHTGERPFACDKCGKSRKIHLKIHMTIHKGEKPFACIDCGRCFRLKSDLKGHMTTHLDVKPFICGYCGVRFTRKASLCLHSSAPLPTHPHPACSVFVLLLLEPFFAHLPNLQMMDLVNWSINAIDHIFSTRRLGTGEPSCPTGWIHPGFIENRISAVCSWWIPGLSTHL